MLNRKDIKQTGVKQGLGVLYNREFMYTCFLWLTVLASVIILFCLSPKDKVTSVGFV